MRFWWRAITRLVGEELRAKELEIFGGPADKAGAGSFVLSVRRPSGLPSPRIAPMKSFIVPDGELTPLGKYLGAAVFREKNGTYVPGKRREWILPDECAEWLVDLKFPSKAFHAIDGGIVPANEAENALATLLHLGGVGLLARRGLGSFLEIKEQRGDFGKKYLDYSAEQRISCLKGHLSNVYVHDALATYCRFSRESRIAWMPLAADHGTDAVRKLAEVLSCAFGKITRDTSLADIFSVQSKMKSKFRRTDGLLNRFPSPLHVHFSRVSDGYICFLTYVPYSYPLDLIGFDEKKPEQEKAYEDDEKEFRRHSLDIKNYVSHLIKVAIAAGGEEIPLRQQQ